MGCVLLAGCLDAYCYLHKLRNVGDLDVGSHGTANTNFVGWRRVESRIMGDE